MHLSYLKVQNTKAMNSQSTNLSSAVKRIPLFNHINTFIKKIYIYTHTHTHTHMHCGGLIDEKLCKVVSTFVIGDF